MKARDEGLDEEARWGAYSSFYYIRKNWGPAASHGAVEGMLKVLENIINNAISRLIELFRPVVQAFFAAPIAPMAFKASEAAGAPRTPALEGAQGAEPGEEGGCERGREGAKEAVGAGAPEQGSN